MTFTALHRTLGVAPGPITDELLNSAVSNGLQESDDLDWKSELPPSKGLTQTDFPKDIAAMANSGGGLIVFGVRESQKAAVERIDVGVFDESYERTLRSAAITAISPPVFGLGVHPIGTEGNRAVAVQVPASVDGPHLIYKNHLFGAPVRNDADTVWMKERQIEAMYRARFNERRHATEALDNLFTWAAAGRNSSERAWLIAVAHPRVPRVQQRLTRDQARDVLQEAKNLGIAYAGQSSIHPLENVDRLNPRPGLRRWIAANTADTAHSGWKEAWASIHHDGSVTLANVVGGHRINRDDYAEGWEIRSTGIECAVADLMALVRATANSTSNDEYEVRVGIEWAGKQPLKILTVDNQGSTYDGVSLPLQHYTSIEITVNALESNADYHWHIHGLAQDCVNQGGVSHVQLIAPSECDDRPK